MLIIFSLTPFTLAQNLQLAILPIGLRVSRPFQIRTVERIFFSFIQFHSFPSI